MKNNFIKGVMFDLARVIEKHSYYRKMLPLLSEWGYNTVFLHLTDDQGCAMEFRSMPEIATPHAFSQDEMRSFVKEADRYNIMVVPEIESLGHTEYITKLPKYRHLYEILPGKHMYSAICPTREESINIFKKLYAETSDIFPSDFIHVGLDEVSFGTCQKCRSVLKKKESWEIFAEYINKLHTIVAELGKQMIMWGDHVLAEKRIADCIPNDIIICDWQYGLEVKSESVEFFTNKGFKAICAPGLVSGSQMILPNIGNLTNIQNFSRIAWEYKKKGVIGLVNTVWEPFRYLQGTINYGLALSGHLFSNKGKISKRFGHDFLETNFGVNDNLNLLAAIKTLHEVSPPWPFMRKATFRVYKEIKVITKEEMQKGDSLSIAAKAIMNTLKKERNKVNLHIKEYDELILAAEIMYILAIRVRTLGKVIKLYRKLKTAFKRNRDKEIKIIVSTIKPMMRDLTKQAHRIHKLTIKNWDLTRYPDDRKRDKIMLIPWGFEDGLTARLGVSAKLLNKNLKEIEDFSRNKRE